jgi:hypothetical protein
LDQVNCLLVLVCNLAVIYSPKNSCEIEFHEAVSV